MPHVVGRCEHRPQGVQMRFVARRRLQGGGLDLDEVPLLEEAAQRLDETPARQKERAAIGMDMRVPPGRGVGASGSLKWAAGPRKRLAARTKIG